MKGLIHGLAFLALLVLTCQACQASHEGNSNQGKVLFQDDFSNSSSGWTQGEDSYGVAEYKDGAFRIYVRSDVAVEISVLRLQPFMDTRVEVDALKTGGPDDNDFGIVCRYVDDNNFYFFEISSDGYYGIGKYKNNELSLIGFEQMQSSEAIRQGSTPNHLRADCVGSTLSFYVNDKKLTQVNDTDFSTGSVGLMAGTFKTPGTEIVFDNFAVLQP